MDKDRVVGFIIQKRLLDAPAELESVKATPNRTFKEAVTDDILATTLMIRDIYIPRHTANEAICLEAAFAFSGLNEEREPVDQYKKVKKLFNSQLTGEGGEIIYPVYQGILNNRHTIDFGFTMQQETRNLSDNLAIQYVAYRPRTIEWENDIRNNTITRFGRLRKHSYELDKEVDIQELMTRHFKSMHTTDVLRVLTRFYWSGGEELRELAIDLLTFQMLLSYYTELKKRFNKSLVF